jgi:hypothetical protein
MEIDEPITDAAKKKFACHCSTSNCRGTMLELSRSHRIGKTYRA